MSHNYILAQEFIIMLAWQLQKTPVQIRRSGATDQLIVLLTPSLMSAATN
jgi:hypothetical protein